MRGTATATFFLATTLVGLALGPYMAGQVSAITHSLSTGVLSTLAIVPAGLIALLIAYRSVPAVAASALERARAAGEPVRSEEHTSETPVTNAHLVCRLLLENKKQLTCSQL